MQEDDIAGGFSFFMDDDHTNDDSSVSIEETQPEVREETIQLQESQETQVADKTDDNGQTESGRSDAEQKRYEYWQSKHDELSNKYKALESEVSTTKDYAPIAEYLYQNPQALLKLQEQLGADTSKVVEDRSPKAPEKPEQPANYNAYEALNDPESVSFKYNQARLDYTTRMIEYMNDKQVYNETVAQEAQRRQQEEYLAQQKQLKFRGDLLAHGLKEEELDTFNQLMYSQDSLKPENIIKYYRLLTQSGMTKEQLATESYEAQQKRLNNNPLPVGNTGGEKTQPPSENDLFNQSLLNYRR